MKFNFTKFVLHDLKNNPDKAELHQKYLKLFPQAVHRPIEKQPWYLEYCSTFRVLSPGQIVVPQDFDTGEYDLDLLQRMLASSFSSEGAYQLTGEADKYDLIFTVTAGETTVTKKLSELWEFQILRLYEIYAEEMMQLQVLIMEDEREKKAILEQRKLKQNKWAEAIDNINSLSNVYNREAASKKLLDDLDDIFND